MLPLHTLAIALALAAVLVYVVFLYRDRGLPDSHEVAAIVSWVLFALVLLVVVQTMTSCPAEHGAIKGFYALSLVVLLINAGAEVAMADADKSRTRALTWVSVLVALIAVLVAAARSDCWQRSNRHLSTVQGEYGSTPGADRVAIAEDVISASGLRPRVMSRMLRTLDRAARKASRK
jgi:uncharacterized membrane protein